MLGQETEDLPTSPVNRQPSQTLGVPGVPSSRVGAPRCAAGAPACGHAGRRARAWRNVARWARAEAALAAAAVLRLVLPAGSGQHGPRRDAGHAHADACTRACWLAPASAPAGPVGRPGAARALRASPLQPRATPAVHSSVQARAGRRPHAARARGRGPARRRARGRADRLLLQRLRKSQSGTALYGDAQAAAEDRECAAEPSVYAAYEGAHSQRLIVVANRLPVSAFKDRDGRWALQARPRPRARPQRRRRPRRAACPLPGQGNPVPPGLRACAAAWAGRARCAHQRLRPRPSCGSARLPPAHEPAWAWEAAAGSCQACRCPAAA